MFSTRRRQFITLLGGAAAGTAARRPRTSFDQTAAHRSYGGGHATR
jgi:hypothetical protein